MSWTSNWSARKRRKMRSRKRSNNLNPQSPLLSNNWLSRTRQSSQRIRPLTSRRLALTIWINRWRIRRKLKMIRSRNLPNFRVKRPRPSRRWKQRNRTWPCWRRSWINPKNSLINWSKRLTKKSKNSSKNLTRPWFSRRDKKLWTIDSKLSWKSSRKQMRRQIRESKKRWRMLRNSSLRSNRLHSHLRKRSSLSSRKNLCKLSRNIMKRSSLRIISRFVSFCQHKRRLENRENLKQLNSRSRLTPSKTKNSRRHSMTRERPCKRRKTMSKNSKIRRKWLNTSTETIWLRKKICSQQAKRQSQKLITSSAFLKMAITKQSQL